VKAWFLVPADGRAICGRCTTEIVPGRPVLVYIGNSRTRWQKFRCSACADEPTPPADSLPPLPRLAALREEWPHDDA